MKSYIFYILFCALPQLLNATINIVKIEIVRPTFYETQSDLHSIMVSIDSAPTNRLNLIIDTSYNSRMIFPNNINYYFIEKLR
jgi:hypothetical protein